MINRSKFHTFGKKNKIKKNMSVNMLGINFCRTLHLGAEFVISVE